MRIPKRLLCVAATLCAVAMVLPACSSSGRKTTVLMTEWDDKRAGDEGSKAVEAQMGVLDDPELNEYVKNIGLKLIRSIPRRRFRYEFSVVDMEAPNAFALPGGHIYVSRGLLALTNSEDELACVLGHEIVHVEHRHAAAQQGLSKRINPIANPWMRAGKMAGYGRDMERDSDKGGQILCAAAGYDPMGMSTFLSNLGQAERLQIGYARGRSFLDSHPGSTERAAVNAVRAREIRRAHDPNLGDTRLRLFEKIDGLPVGQRPESGVFEGDRFLHPLMDFQLRFPPGWEKQNTASAVGALSPRGDSVVYLTADQPYGEARAMAEVWVAKTQDEQRLDVRESKPVKVGDIDAWRMRLKAGGVQSLVSYVTFIPYGSSTFRIVGMSPSIVADKYLGRTLSTSRSFRPLAPEDRALIMRTNLQIATARRGRRIR